MSEYTHWCGNCQIRVYIQRHYGNRLSWQDCPYTCEYATAMRCYAQSEQNKEKLLPHKKEVRVEMEDSDYRPDRG